MYGLLFQGPWTWFLVAADGACAASLQVCSCLHLLYLIFLLSLLNFVFFLFSFTSFISFYFNISIFCNTLTSYLLYTFLLSIIYLNYHNLTSHSFITLTITITLTLSVRRSQPFEKLSFWWICCYKKLDWVFIEIRWRGRTSGCWIRTEKSPTLHITTGMMWCHVMSCHVIRCDVTWCAKIWCDVIWCNFSAHSIMHLNITLLPILSHTHVHTYISSPLLRCPCSSVSTWQSTFNWPQVHGVVGRPQYNISRNKSRGNCSMKNIAFKYVLYAIFLATLSVCVCAWNDILSQYYVVYVCMYCVCVGGGGWGGGGVWVL